MTKSFLYVKIIIMKNITLMKKLKLSILLFLTATLLTCFAVISFTTVKADESAQPVAEMFTPLSALETGSNYIVSPSDVYSDDSVTAIVCDNTTKLIVYQNGTFSEIQGTAFQIVKKYDDNTLLATDDGNIHKIELNNNFAKSQLQDATGLTLGCNYFDLNENYLVKAFSGKGIVYQKTANGYTTDTKDNFEADGNYPVAINKNNEIFYVFNSNLYKRYADDSSKEAKEIIIKSATDTPTPPTRMIADTQYVYYIWETELYKIDHTAENPVPQKLTVNGADKNLGFDLGQLSAPKSLTFKGENILITDGNTVQEYKVDGTELTFTGFAVASDKTAYNRIGKSALDVEKHGDTVAVLDDYKLTVYTASDKADRYSRSNYKNYLKSALVLEEGSVVTPSSFALGKNSALLSYNDGTANSALRILNLTDGVLTEKYSFTADSIIRDVCYQSGYYYVLADNGSAPQHVYRAIEGSLDFIKIDSNIESAVSYSNIAVDVYGNVYLSNATTVVKYSKADNYTTRADCATGLTAIKKVQTDLGGGIFVLSENSLSYIKNGVNTLNISAPSNLIKSFAMDFICNDVYFIYDNAEYIGLSKTLPNIALSTLTVPEDYKITANTATNTLTVCTANAGANVYSVNKDGGQFVFNSLIESGEQYLYICKIEKVSISSSVNMCALAGKNGIVLTDELETISSTLTTIDATFDKAYVTTDVSGYYFPILTENGEYALSNANGAIRIEKETQISPLKELTFLDNEFYYAQFSIGENTAYGYVPKAFTVNVLSEDFKWSTYKVEKVNKTEFYTDALLTTVHEVKPELTKGEQVRLIETLDGVSKVLVSDGNGGYYQGYIKTSAFQNEPSRAVRNILIILAVAGSVCGTTAYFVTRKKDL